MVVMVLTDEQMMTDAMDALRESQHELAIAQVRILEAMSSMTIFEDRFRKGEYKRDDLNGGTLTVTQNELAPKSDTVTRISAEMKEYMHKAKAKHDDAASKKKWSIAMGNCKCGNPHLDPDYSKAGDFVA